MNEQIKQRITQLNNGEVPSGYKKTEIGVFPTGWQTTTLDKLLDFKNGVNADKEKYSSGIKMISVTDILTDTPILYDSIKGHVDIDDKTLDTYSVTYGDILFQRSSETVEDAGKSNVYLDPNKTATYSGFVIRGKKKAEYNPYFLNEALRIGQVRSQIMRNAAGSQHINIAQDSLANIIVPIASADEQAKIAEILIKWDEAIELQKEYNRILCLKQKMLITKVMSSVTGDTKPLSDCVKYYPSNLLVKELSYVEGGYPVYGATGVVTLIDNYCFNCKTVAIIKYGSSAGKVVLLDGKHSVLGTMSEMVPMEGIDIEYIYYLLKTFPFKKYIEISTTPNVYFEDYSKEKVVIPSYEKQKEIAKTLNYFECIVQANEAKLDLLRKQRKSLQQYLLNGIVRV